MECIDDSLLMATEIEQIKEIVYMQERFQYAYGWSTSWEKSSVSVLNPGQEHAETIKLVSISPEDKENPLKKRTINMPIIQNRIEFMKVWIDENETGFGEIAEVIENFRCSPCLNNANQKACECSTKCKNKSFNVAPTNT